MAKRVHVNFHLHLDTETVAQARPLDPLTIEPQTSVRQVMDLLKVEEKGSVLVCRDGRLIGIFTERDALRLMADNADLTIPIEQVMTADPVTISINDTVGTAITRMSEGGYRRLPVVDSENHPVGMLTVSRILNYLVEHFPTTIYNLPPAPHHATQNREGA